MLYTDKDKAIEAITNSEGKIHIIPDKEYKELLDNFKNTEIITEVEKRIDEKTREIHDRYDTDIYELTGEKKKPEEKTYQFLKRKITELKEKADSKDHDEEVENIRAKAQKDLQERDNKIQELLESMNKNELKAELRAAMNGLKFREDIPEKYKKKIIEDEINAIVEHSKKDGDVTRWKNSSDDFIGEDYRPLSAEKVVQHVFKDLIDLNTSFGGGGRPASVKKVGNMTNIEATKYLIEVEKLQSGTPDFQAKFKELTGIGSKDE
ncbi:MAG: hypothetical protein EOL88_02305 [Bacteroidia bacterium]|nr:hypothetical protein [Bacteroidia bacterium]